MTPAQNDARHRILDLMREHFSSGVFVLEGDGDEEGQHTYETQWHGGFAAAIGLLEIGKAQALESREVSEEET